MSHFWTRTHVGRCPSSLATLFAVGLMDFHASNSKYAAPAHLITLYANGFENTNSEETTIPENHVYVIGDDWFRTNYIGPIAKERIIGKVLGYK